MDIKDVKPRKVAEANSVQGSQSSNQRSVSVLAAKSIEATLSDPVKLQVAVRNQPASTTDVRAKANQVIDAVNHATEATAEIEKLVESVDGIVEQADEQSLPPQRKEVLEQEANSLVEEIRRRAQTPTASGVRPLAGDRIIVEMEAKLGKALEVILPEDATEAFGIGTVRLSTKDTIIQTRSNIEEGRRRLDALKLAVQDTKERVAGALSELEVALQNREASSATIRDVDKALELTSSIRTEIKDDPDRALHSFTKLEEDSLSLLK